MGVLGPRSVTHRSIEMESWDCHGPQGSAQHILLPPSPVCFFLGFIGQDSRGHGVSALAYLRLSEFSGFGFRNGRNVQSGFLMIGNLSIVRAGNGLRFRFPRWKAARWVRTPLSGLSRLILHKVVPVHLFGELKLVGTVESMLSEVR